MGSRLHTNPTLPRALGQPFSLARGTSERTQPHFPAKKMHLCCLIVNAKCSAGSQRAGDQAQSPCQSRGSREKPPVSFFWVLCRARSWAGVIPVGSFQLRIFSDSLILHLPPLEQSIFQGGAPRTGSRARCARGCCSPAHLRAQWALCPGSTPQTWNIARHTPELGVSHRALWDCATGHCSGRKTHTAHRETEAAFSVCCLGTEFALQAPALGFSLQKMGFLPRVWHLPPGRQG